MGLTSMWRDLYYDYEAITLKPWKRPIFLLCIGLDGDRGLQSVAQMKEEHGYASANDIY